MADKKVLPNIPTFVSKQPASAAIVSKLISSRKEENINKTPINLPDISKSIKDHLRNTDDIMTLYPEIELISQILVSSILSPNDMLTSSLTYKAPDLKLPIEVKQVLIDKISSYIEDNYKLENKLSSILKEAMVTRGAYIEAIIPEAAVDDIINPYSKDGQISLEHLDIHSSKYMDKLKETIDKKLSSRKGRYLDNDPSNYALSTEELKIFTSNDKPNLTIADLDIIITDDPSQLAMSDMTLSLLDTKLTTEAFKDLTTDAELEINNLFRNTDSVKQVPMIHVNNFDGTSRRSIGKPLVFKLPVEAVIPVHVINDPTRHLGYFILLDEQGAPLVADYSKIDNDLTGNNANMTLQVASTSNIISRARSALFGMTKKDATLGNIEAIYNSIVEKTIKDKLRNGMYGELADIKDNSDIYRVMFFRMLKGYKTKILYLPADLVAFYAFEFRENGTGKSMIEKVQLLYSIRAILLFSNIMATVKNSVTTTHVTAELDEHDIDPESTMEKVISESLKTRQTNLPLGAINLTDLVDWAHSVGISYEFKHPSLPNMTINTEDKNTNKVIPDMELDKRLQEHIIMSFYLTPEIVETGYNAEFATTVISKNLLLAKRVAQIQLQLEPLISKHINKLLINDSNLRDILKGIVKNNLPSIKKLVKKKTTDDSDKELARIKDDDLIEYVVKQYCTGISVTLPSPEMEEAQALHNAFVSYKTNIEEFIELVFSTQAIPEEYVGNFGGKIENLKAALKVTLLRKWMADNNYLPELNEFMTLDDDGKPVFNVLDEFSVFIKNMVDASLPFLKNNKKFTDKINTLMEKIDANSQYDDDTEGNNIASVGEEEGLEDNGDPGIEKTGTVEEIPIDDTGDKLLGADDGTVDIDPGSVEGATDDPAKQEGVEVVEEAKPVDA